MNQVDMELSRSILDKYNKGLIGRDPKAKLKEIPVIDNKTVLNRDEHFTLKITEGEAKELIEDYNLPETLLKKWIDRDLILNNDNLKEIGIYLYPYFSFGVLNGGSATSYVDRKKNLSFNQELFNHTEELFDKLSKEYKGKAKGITPAFINPDGSTGPSFMELKMRSLLLKAKEYRDLTGDSKSNLFPMFQMTSTSNNDDINNYYTTLKESEFISDLVKETGIEINSVLSGIQPLITAYTHSDQGEIKDIFRDSTGSYLGLPGGHGQCFIALKEIFLTLYNRGIKFISIGNVDNIGYTLDPVSLAILALKKKQASFDFSVKTKFDIKGGILIKDQFNNINCADLGVAVSQEDVDTAQKEGKAILFNCATGLFNLEYLISNLETIINKLPTRFSDQNKDIGKYSQGEQVTWEIISLLDDFLIYGVNKYDRFLASKLLLENLVTSGITYDGIESELKEWGDALNSGLINKLKEMDLELVNNRWRPKKC